jgi:SAM-dependent methyltransferase
VGRFGGAVVTGDKRSDADASGGGVNVWEPSWARVYDYYLGGKDNFAVDRELGDKTIAKFPSAPLVALQNRAFLGRAARVLVQAGIRQFLDLGSGLPTRRNLHEVAQDFAPDSRVVYVDNDPIVLAHGGAILAKNPLTRVITADLREPETVLAHQDVLELLDFSRPVGLMMVAVGHFVPDLHPIVAAYRDRLASGSYLVLSHVTADGADRDLAAQSERDYQAAGGLVFRTTEEIADLFAGFDLLEPGLVPTYQWRPDVVGGLVAPTDESSPLILAGIGRLP